MLYNIALDIGCGDVFFLSQFKDSCKDFNVFAVDNAFNDEIIKALSNKYEQYNISFFKDINEINTEGQTVSILFLLDVIEHIEHDGAFLKSIINMPFVGENTLIVISVPAFQSLYCEHDKWLGHYRRYSRNSLIAVAKQNGCHIITSGYFFCSLLIIRAIQKATAFLLKKEKAQVGLGNWKYCNSISKLYSKVLICDFYLCKWLHLPGLSTYVLCKTRSQNNK